MKFYPRWAVTAVFVAALGVSPAANAALVDRGGGLIYDQDLNITWLANANVNGPMTWNNAMTWTSNFSYYDSVRNVTYDDWRLPTTLQPDATCSILSSGAFYGYNCTGSEMGHLFYTELGGTAGSSILSSTDPDLTLFTNVQSSTYWSGTEYVPSTVGAWAFGFDGGYFGGGVQGAYDKHINYYAWAVRPGDVAAVPLPAAAWLFGSGLLGLIGIGIKRARVTLNA